jgi:DNA polymerase alpha subunit A
MESRKNKLQALAAYKRAREGGERTYTERDAKIYDEVTETEYKVRRA